MTDIFRSVSLIFTDLCDDATITPGWAYNVISSDGEHTSGAVDIEDAMGSAEEIPDVIAAMEWPAVALAVDGATWTPEHSPDASGWICRLGGVAS